MTESTFVCVDCGFGGVGPRSLLEAHWKAAGHGPANQQRDALGRARASIGAGTPIARHSPKVVRLKPRTDPPGDLG